MSDLRSKFLTANISPKSRALPRTGGAAHRSGQAETREKMRHFGEVLTDIVMPDLDTVETESSLELNFFIGKLKHSVRRVKRANSKEQA